MTRKLTINRFDSICDASRTTPAGLNVKETLQYHYFNPNGLVHAKRANDELISNAVAAKLCRGGMIIAHGTFSHFDADHLCALATQRGRVLRYKAASAIEGLQHHVAQQRAILTRINAGEFTEAAYAKREAAEAAERAASDDGARKLIALVCNN